MALTIKYFASLREQLGRGEDSFAPDGLFTVADVWAAADDGRPLPDNVRSAVNLEYVTADHPVHDGDEVAFFPPVTGG